MNPLIRPATKDDVPMIAEVVLLASRSHLETGVFYLMIESNDGDRLAFIRAMLTTQQRSWCHFENFLVAEVDGRPAAALSGYAAHDTTLLPLEQAFVAGFRAIGMSDAQIGASFQRSLVFLKCSSDDEPKSWIIEWVACLDTFRRRGLVRALLPAVINRGRDRGHTLTQIGIIMGNTSAQRAYEDAGFVLDHEKTDADFEAAIGSPGLARLLRID
jgi:GNAT superfamily N-acetyltransferase